MPSLIKLFYVLISLKLSQVSLFWGVRGGGVGGKGGLQQQDEKAIALK